MYFEFPFEKSLREAREKEQRNNLLRAALLAQGRVSQIRNIGVIEGNCPVSDNEWEEVKKGGESAIKQWMFLWLESLLAERQYMPKKMSRPRFLLALN